MIEFNHVTKHFGSKKVLNDVSFHVNKGECVSIIGRSGTGKTTLTRLMNRLTKFDSGEIKIAGIDLNKRNIKKIREQVGYIFQDFNLFFNMNVMDNITYKSIKVLKKDSVSVLRYATELLERFNIPDDILDKYPSDLSGGQKQRIAIIRALMERPRVLIMDEPTASLDLELIGEVVDIINEIKASGITVVIVSHNLDVSYKVSDKILFLTNGKCTDFVDRDTFFNANNISTEATTFLKDCGYLHLVK